MVRKCENCKYITASTGTTWGGSSLFCKFKKGEINPESNCLRFVKRDGRIDKLQKHLKMHWKFWITTLVAIIGVLIAILSIK